jgi:hypothetical protein
VRSCALADSGSLRLALLHQIGAGTCRDGMACRRAGKHSRIVGGVRPVTTRVNRGAAQVASLPAANVTLLTGVWFDAADVDGQSGVEALRAILLEAGRRRARGCTSEFATRAYPPASRQAGAAGRGTHPPWSIRESFVPISRQPGSSVCSTTSSKGQQMSAAVASIRQTPAIHRRNGARRLRKRR